jgi:L-alanine-DL-glutamate epimerase-like enolase superfamily enzyme
MATRRRDFLKTLTALAGTAAAPAAALAQSAGPAGYDNKATHHPLAGRAKIKDVVNVPLRVEKDLGPYPDWLGNPRNITIGGGSYVEVRTDQGVTGIGPGVDPALMAGVKRTLLDQDPLDINLLAERLYGLSANRGPAGAEIAVWDLIGKMAGQPLYKLWGGGRDRVIPYASMLRLSTPQERGQLAAKLKADGWKAIKIRSSFATLKEDVQVVEEIRKACGDDFVIMSDGNKATLNLSSTQGITWDFSRALATAREYERLGVYWLEEPFQRYDLDDLARLKSHLTTMFLAGGEGNRRINEFKDLLDRNCYDIIQPEVMLEGPSHLRKIAVLAEAQGKMCIPHEGDSRLGTVCDLHLIASWPNAPYLEIFNDQPIGDYTNPFAIFESPILLDKDGYFNLPQGPGLGMKIRQDLIQKS